VKTREKRHQELAGEERGTRDLPKGVVQEEQNCLSALVISHKAVGMQTIFHFSKEFRNN
jgi:hypothetical protein